MEGNLPAYRIFYTVARKGNISYAARELFISQPAISKAILRLEESLGCRLFFRSSKGVSLTEEGKILYEQVKKAFEALEDGEAQIRRFREFEAGRIRIGASATLCKYVLIPYLKGFIGRYPHVEITISCQSTYHTIKLLEEDRIDIGLIGKFGFGKDIIFHPVQKIQDIFVASKGYLENFYQREGKKKLPDFLQAVDFLLLDEENISRRYIDRYFEENRIVPKQILSVESMDLLIEFAKIGLGAACVIREFVEQELKDGILCAIPVFKEMRKREIGFAYSPKKGMTQSMKKFITFVENEYDPG